MTLTVEQMGALTDDELRLYARLQGQGRVRRPFPTPFALAHAVDPTHANPPHLKMLDEKLGALLRGDIDRLLVMMPPRHGKSLRMGRWLPLWAWQHHPDWPVMLVSYGVDLARDHARFVRDVIRDRGAELGLSLASDDAAAGHFTLAGGGSLLAVGANGPITGRGPMLGIVDDPVKDRAAVESVHQRRVLWEWWRSTWRSRWEPGARIVVIMQRWHPQDLAAQLISEQGEVSEGGAWTVLKLPAIAADNDPLGRVPGAALWPERYDVDDLGKIRAEVGSYAWASQYQQEPTAREGGLWRSDLITLRPAPEATTKRVVAVDPSYGVSDASDECGIVVACRDWERISVLADRSGKLGPSDWPARAWLTAVEHDADLIVERTGGVDLLIAHLEQAWKALGLDLPQPRLRQVHAQVGKVLRAGPVVAAYERGEVTHVQHFLDLEDEMFGWQEGMASPNRLDALVYAVSDLLGTPSPVEIYNPAGRSLTGGFHHR